MTTRLIWERAQRYRGENLKGHQTFFDTSIKGGGLDSAPSPMEAVLEAAASCSAMDLTRMLEKRRKSFRALTIDMEADRADHHPQVFTHIRMHVILTSENATANEVGRSIELSWSTYCSVSIMLKRSGCEMSWRATIVRPSDRSQETISQQELTAVQDHDGSCVRNGSCSHEHPCVSRVATPAVLAQGALAPAAITPAAVSPAAVTPAVVAPAAVAPAPVAPAAVAPAAVAPEGVNNFLIQ